MNAFSSRPTYVFWLSISVWSMTTLDLMVDKAKKITNVNIIEKSKNSCKAAWYLVNNSCKKLWWVQSIFCLSCWWHFGWRAWHGVTHWGQHQWSPLGLHLVLYLILCDVNIIRIFKSSKSSDVQMVAMKVHSLQKVVDVVTDHLATLINDCVKVLRFSWSTKRTWTLQI